MPRAILAILLGSAVYGFSAGSVNSLQLATWNLLKFPLLIFLTSLICSPAYYVFSQFVTRELSFRDVCRLSLRTFADVSILLASWAPVAFFLAKTIVQPDQGSLNEYPLFLGLNVLFIGTCGVVALVRQAARLLKGHRLSIPRSVGVMSAWLAVSLFAGGQCAWYLRPFFGCSAIRNPPFMEGSHPDYRGARSFYEAVYHLVDPPPLPREYYRHRR